MDNYTNSSSINTVGVAIIGCGFAAKFHVEAYKRVHGVPVRIIGVHSRNLEKTQAFAATHGIEKIYKSLAELLQDSEVDLVDVCVPNRSHEEMAIKVLEAGKHVAVEKPFTGSFTPPTEDPAGGKGCLEQAQASSRRMLEAERSSGRHIMYAENWVYAPGVQKAKRLLSAADTPILRIVGEESHSGTHSPYAMDWRTSGGGSLLNKGCHILGAAIYLKYEEGIRRLGKRIRPSWVVGTVANLTRSEAFLSESQHSIRTGWKDCEDWATMVLGFDDGSVAQITAADTVVGGIQNLMTIYAAKATLHININPNNALLAYTPDSKAFETEYIREKVETTAGWQFTNPDEDWMNGFPHEMQDFCESVSCDRKPMSGSFLGNDVVTTCYSAYLSAASGEKIIIPTL